MSWGKRLPRSLKLCKKMTPTVMIVDGHYALHRMLHLPDMASLQTQGGVKTGGIFGVVNSLKRSLEKFPSVRKCIITWDTDRSRRRLALLPTYKANRDVQQTDEDIEEKEAYNLLFRNQLSALQANLGCLGVRQVLLNGREGDDLIGWLCLHVPGATVVVTEDKDMFQLVSDSVTVWRPLKESLLTLGTFETQVGVDRRLYLLYKALLGDSSDNIPGISQVGPKTIQTVLKTASSMATGRWGDQPVPLDGYEELLTDACESQPMTKARKLPSKVQRILDGLDTFRLNVKLMDLYQETFTEAEEVVLDVLVNGGSVRFNEEKAVRFFGQYEFNSLLQWFSQSTQFFRLLS